jgi:GTP pyrophosphokinase
MVLACSDSTDEQWKQNTDYWERKRAYLDHLETGDSDALLVSIADKVHNARAIVTDLQQHGAGVLDKFNGTPTQILEYYTECLRIAIARELPAAVVKPLQTAVAQIDHFVHSS